MKRILAAALALVMVLGTLPSVPAFAYGNPNPDKYDNSGDYFKTDPYYDVSWFDYKKKKGIPLELPYVNKDGFFFNKELFDDLGVTVYGDYKDVADNEFKPGSIIFGADGETRLGEDMKKGYYENSTGEYRYHGYDAQGNRYANRNFRLDADSGTRPEQKHWIYRVWDKDSVYHYYYSEKLKGVKRIAEASDYNEAATEELGIGDKTYDSQIKFTRQWINDTLPFEIKRGTNSDKSPYNYAHVQTRPTTYRTGEALMFHDPYPEIRTGQNTGLWYQVFSLEKVKNKSYIPHKGFIKVVQGDDVITESEMAKKANMTFDVKLSGVLNDEHLWDNKKGAEFSDDVLRGVYYNREDIKQWNFELKDTITGKTLKKEGVEPAINMGSTVFEVVMTYDDYSEYITEENRKLNPVFNGIVEIEYHNGVKKRVPVSTDANVVAPMEPKEETLLNQPVPPDIKDPLLLDISAPKEMLDTERFGITDNTVLHDGFTREVYLRGEKLSDVEAEIFLSGNYLFPLEGRDIIYDYLVK
ncbi:Athe_2463 domain-containing protein [Fusibacter sp. JL298sf-3]